ncbi:MAG: S-layer homology domain-containing protein, partial [Clostridia bacterium]|nr:S-layer homology domain-containing protein [Clostridia bacterium]
AVDGVVTLKHVRRDQKISVTFEKLPWVNPYIDVPADAAYLDALAYVCESGLMNGISADGTLFDPEASMTRAMFITVLGRLAGVGDEFIGALGFADVPADAYYAPYVGWAKFAGITSGDGTGNFGSDDALSVEQAVTFLARYRAHMGYPVESDASLSGYTDAADISAWAADAMAWAVGNGICIGEDGKLNPHSNVSRAMAAQMIFAFVNAFGK